MVTFSPVTRYFYIEIGSNAHEQCFTRCPVSLLVHSPGRPESVITWKISIRDPCITVLGSLLTGRLTKMPRSLQSEIARLM